LWCLLVALVLVLADRRLSLAKGQVFALYGMLYTLGRFVIEMMRTDAANHILGLRLNVWTSVVVFAGSAFAFWRLGVRGHAAEGDIIGEVSGEPGSPADDPSPSQHLD